MSRASDLSEPAAVAVSWTFVPVEPTQPQPTVGWAGEQASPGATAGSDPAREIALDAIALISSALGAALIIVSLLVL